MEEHVKQLLSLGREHFHKGELDEAEYLLKQVATKENGYADVFDMLGIIAHTRGDYTQAGYCFERALELNPLYTEARLNLMVTYNELGRYDDSRALAERVPQEPTSRPGDPFVRGKIANLHAETARAYQDAGMLTEAIIELEKAVALGPGFPDLRCRLARLHRDAGEPDMAVGQLRAAIDANPSYLEAYLQLAAVQLSTGHGASALPILREAKKLHPDDVRTDMYMRAAQASSSVSAS